MFYPHFYIEHNGFYIDAQNGIIKRQKILTIEEKQHHDKMIDDYINNINFNLNDENTL